MYFFSRPLGISTGFGQFEGGPFAWSFRIWFHFGINAIATVYAIKAVWPAVTAAAPASDSPSLERQAVMA